MVGKKEIFKFDKVVGYVIGDSYVKHTKPEHFMRKFQGFGISQSVLQSLVTLNIKYIIIEYQGTQGLMRWKTTVNKFYNSDKTYTDTLNGEEDLQKFVGLKEMEEI